MAHKHICVLCGSSTPRGTICERCSRQERSLFSSMTTDYLQERREARTIRIHQRRIYGK